MGLLDIYAMWRNAQQQKAMREGASAALYGDPVSSVPITPAVPMTPFSKGVMSNGMLPGQQGNMDLAKAGDNWSTNEISEGGIPKHYVLPSQPGDRLPSGDGTFLGDAALRYQKTGQNYGAFDTDAAGADYMNRQKAYAAPTSTGGVLNAVPESQRPFLKGWDAAFGPQSALKQAYQTNVPNVTGQEAAYETFDGQHDPYGRGGAGQRNTRTNQIVGYQDPIKPQAPTPPVVRNFVEGGNDVSKQYDPATGQWNEVSRGPRFKADSAAGQQVTWNNPIQESGPDGKPIMVRYSNTGGRQIVEGATPRPTQRALPAKVVNDLVQAGTAVDTWARLKDTYKDEYAGQPLTGGINNMIGRTFGDKGQAQWWQDYQGFINPERNRIFGSALTPGEKAEWEKAMINPSMAPSQIRDNLKRQSELSEKAARRHADPYIKSNYDKEAIEGALGFSLDEIPKVPPPGTPIGGATPQAQQGGSDVLNQARDAIAKGAPRDAVIRRLQERGINPAGL